MAGLTPTPFSSGKGEREQGIGKDGSRWIRGAAIEFAWGWLRFQPQSELSQWYQRRFGHGSTRLRKLGIVALARKLLIALWRFLETGVIPEGALLKTELLASLTRKGKNDRSRAGFWCGRLAMAARCREAPPVRRGRPPRGFSHAQAYTGSGVRCIAIGTDRRSFAGFAPTLHELLGSASSATPAGDRHVASPSRPTGVDSGASIEGRLSRRWRALMAEEILENPITGERLRILESTPETFKVHYSLRPHTEIAAEHFHPGKQQRVTVLSGEMHLRINGEHHVVRAGESATVPPGGHHFQWNPCDPEVVAIEEICPAGRLHEFFSVLFRLARDGKTDSRGRPSAPLGRCLVLGIKGLGPRSILRHAAHAGCACTHRLSVGLSAPAARAISGFARRPNKPLKLSAAGFSHASGRAPHGSW